MSPADSVLETDDLAASLFWEKHKKTVLAVAAAGVVAGVVAIAWYVTSTLKAEHAVTALANAFDPAQLEAVARDYRGTEPGANALLLLAASKRDAGDSDGAVVTFQDFLKTYPNNPLAGGALLGVGQTLDAQGKTDDAISTYQQVVDRYPKSYAAPFAAYAMAEVFLRDLRRDEARTALDSLVSQFPDSSLSRVAAAQLARLNKSK